MTIGGVDAIVAFSVLAALGDISRFSFPQKLVSYLGLNPSVDQPVPSETTVISLLPGENDRQFNGTKAVTLTPTS